MVTEMCLPFSRLNGNWMETEMRLKSTFPVTIQWPFSHHSVTIQSTERWDFILCMPKKIQYEVVLEVIFAQLHSCIKELQFFTASHVIFDRACPFLIGFIIFAWIKRRLAVLGTGLHGGDPWQVCRKNQSNHCIWSKYKTLNVLHKSLLDVWKYFCIVYSYIQEFRFSLIKATKGWAKIRIISCFIFNLHFIT